MKLGKLIKHIDDDQLIRLYVYDMGQERAISPYMSPYELKVETWGVCGLSFRQKSTDPILECPVIKIEPCATRTTRSADDHPLFHAHLALKIVVRCSMDEINVREDTNEPYL